MRVFVVRSAFTSLIPTKIKSEPVIIQGPFDLDPVARCGGAPPRSVLQPQPQGPPGAPLDSRHRRDGQGEGATADRATDNRDVPNQG